MRWPGLLKLIVLILLSYSCTKNIPTLEGIDRQVWKKDRGGCNLKRAPMIGALKKEKDKLLALDEMQVVSLLGRPDHNELFEHHQKFYYYFLEPSGECSNPGKSPLRLIIRFNAMGLAKEVLIE